jgi:hypothetical protein
MLASYECLSLMNVLISYECPCLLPMPSSLVNAVISFQCLPSSSVFLYPWILLQGPPLGLFRHAETGPSNPLITDNAIADIPAMTLIGQFWTIESHFFERKFVEEF